jgi:FkbM family methyltransferase
MSNYMLSTAAWMAKWIPTPLKRALYRFKSLSGFIRGALNRAAPTGLTVVEVAAGGLAGYKLRLDLQTEKDYWLGTYESELQIAVADLLQDGMVAYDVGANIGYVSLLLARAVGEAGRVFSFEALPSNLDRLQENVELNNLQPRVKLVPAAVIDSQKQVEFLVGPSGGMGKAQGSAGRTEFQYQEKILVQAVSLDQFVYQDGNDIPDLIKLDIEGGEVLALPGMQRVLEEAHPIVLLELHGEQAAKVAWKVFNESGYRICLMKPGYPQVPSLESLDWKAYLVAFPMEE